MIRPVRLADRRRPRRFLEPVRARVPAMAGQIDAAAERELVVDDDDLLMVRAADGMAIVEAEPDAARHPPAEPPSRERIALERVERAVVPGQDVAAQVRAPAGDEREQLVEPRRRVGRRGRPASRSTCARRCPSRG